MASALADTPSVYVTNGVTYRKFHVEQIFECKTDCFLSGDIIVWVQSPFAMTDFPYTIILLLLEQNELLSDTAAPIAA